VASSLGGESHYEVKTRIVTVGCSGAARRSSYKVFALLTAPYSAPVAEDDIQKAEPQSNHLAAQNSRQAFPGLEFHSLPTAMDLSVDDGLFNFEKPSPINIATSADIPPVCQESARSDTMSTYRPAEEYNNQIPNLPIISVPPPIVSDGLVQRLDIGPPVFNPDPLYNVDFLKETDYVNVSSYGNWQYKMRREAQPVVPFLYVGPVSNAKNKEFLRENGITMLVGVQPRSPFGIKLTEAAIRSAKELDLANEIVEIGDPHELISAFPIATRAINRHLAWMHRIAQTNPDKDIGLGKVFVFCESGSEKSAAIAAAWLMETFEDVSCIRAMQIILTRRFCCNFDEVLKNVLRHYEVILKAKRDVQRATASGGALQDVASSFSHSGQIIGHKRSLRRDDASDWDRDGAMDEDVDEMESSDWDMMDAERFEGRSPAPFL
jgi:hypothetical protein